MGAGEGGIGGPFSAFGLDIAGIGGIEKALDGWRGLRGALERHTCTLSMRVDWAEQRGGGVQSETTVAIWQAGPPWGFFTAGREVGIHSYNYSLTTCLNLNEI